MNFEQHLIQELQIHKFLQRNYDFMLENLCMFEKKTGIEANDKEIYVLNKHPDPKKYINLKKLVSSNGGLIRIPFLCKS